MVAASRAVQVTLSLDSSSYIRALKEAEQATQALIKAGESSVQKQRQAVDQLAGVAGGLAGIATVGLGAIVATTANFDEKMSHVAATGDEARASLDRLRKAAIDAGASTAFSATEAAGGIENLLKAGLSAEDVLAGGLAGALDLAAAGGLQVADAAEIAATALTQFRLSGEAVPHVADLLAAAAGKAQGDVSDMAMALKQSGLVASQMGLSLEETTGTLASFASAGLLGSDAGTSFRTMLLALANPSKESARLMRELGISAYDTSGDFVGMAGIAGQLQTAFEGKTQAERDSALATIFGSDAIRAASVLYAQGTQGVQDWTSKVDDAGYAADTAATRLDNLKGDLEELQGALETALIGAGEGSEGSLRQLTQSATDLVNVFNDLPSSVKSTATGLVGLTAAVGGTFWVGNKVVGAYRDAAEAIATVGTRADGTKRSLRDLATISNGMRAGAGIALIADQATGLSSSMGLANTASLALMGTMLAPGWGTAIGATTGLMLDLAAANDDVEESLAAASQALSRATGFGDMEKAVRSARASVEEFKNSFFSGSEWLTSPDVMKGLRSTKNWFEGLVGDSDVEEAKAKFNEISDAAFDARKNAAALAIELGAATETEAMFPAWMDKWIDEGPQAFEKTTVSIEDMDAALRSAAPAMANLGIDKAFKDLNPEELAQVAVEIRRIDSEGGRLSALGDAFSGLNSEMVSTAESAQALLEGMDALLGPGMNLAEATDAWNAGLRNLKDNLAENGRSLTANTDAADQNRAAIRDMVGTLKDRLVAEAEAGASGEKLAKMLKRQREALLDAGEAAGLSRDEVKDYANQLGLTPKMVKTIINLVGADKAKSDAAALKAMLDDLPPSVSTTIKVGWNIAANPLGAMLNPLNVLTRADGGAVPSQQDFARAAGGALPYRGPIPDYEALVAGGAR